jgi:hypothetical protein
MKTCKKLKKGGEVEMGKRHHKAEKHEKHKEHEKKHEGKQHHGKMGMPHEDKKEHHARKKLAMGGAAKVRQGIIKSKKVK